MKYYLITIMEVCCGLGFPSRITIQAGEGKYEEKINSFLSGFRGIKTKPDSSGNYDTGDVLYWLNDSVEITKEEYDLFTKYHI